jgi:hypothetical protein
MYGPTALTTPTRLPWWWPLLVGWLLLALMAPVYASDVAALPRAASDVAAERMPYRIGEWQLVGMDAMLHSLAEHDDAQTARMLPLAVLPSLHSAWWLGLSASRSAGARVELRWTLPLDGTAAWRPRSDD